jgi:hypothetical protein
MGDVNMNKATLAQRFFVIVFMFLTGCGSNATVQVTELSNNTVSYDETIHINNCGGKADSEQTASRAFATTIEGGAEFKVGYEMIVEGGVSAKYSQYRNVSKSQRVIAPPGTNMEFILRWSEDVHAGNVTVSGVTGTYEAHVPIAVEQVASQDLGCNVSPGSECAISENIAVSFTDGVYATDTENSYKGKVTITVSGVGQSSGTQYSDAFYLFTDGDNNLITPDSTSGFTLTINGDLAYYLIPNERIPAYRSNHNYEFEISAPGGNLSFGVADEATDDNTGSYELTLCQP